MLRLLALLAAAICLTAPASGASSDAALRTALQSDLNQYLSSRAKIEHISAISLSVGFRGAPQNMNVTAGRTTYGGDVPVAPSGLWQIGSNTKAFTAVTILQLEAEGKLNIDQTVGHWLPQYPAWKSVTIRRLLNMTSGIPSYDNDPTMLTDYAKNPKRNFALSELIAYVNPANDPALKPTSGYSYSNTNYLLSEMIITRASGHTYAYEIGRRFIRSNLGLTNTYYAVSQYPKPVRDRLVAGYFFNHDAYAAPLAPLLGTNVINDSMSWTQAAGGIVSTPEDLTRWARAMYTGKLLAPKQQAELLAIVSQKTGKPIAKTSAQDPRGFGLGVAQITLPDIGTVWFYEGGTFGHRTVHVYFPREDAVIAFGVNSQPNGKDDQVGKLIAAIYKTLHSGGKL